MNRTVYLPRPWIGPKNPGKGYVKLGYWHRVVRVKLPRLNSKPKAKRQAITPM